MKLILKYFDLLIGSAVVRLFLVVNYDLVNQLIQYRRIELFHIGVLADYIYKLSR